MKLLDRVFQRWRIAMAAPWIRPGDRLLDVGCDDGKFLVYLGGRIVPSVGLEPKLEPGVSAPPPHQILQETFPHCDFPPEHFDCISLLAVLEHIPAPDLAMAVNRCQDWLKVGGRLIITVPSPLVDRILMVLKALRLVDGMCVDEHYGFRPSEVVQLFRPPDFELLRYRRFQLGLNNLYVYQKNRNR